MSEIEPQVGDIWEVKRPGKRKIVKEVGAVYFERQRSKQFVRWRRLPKGRYSGLSVEALLLHGKRLTTKAERDKADRERWARQDAKWTDDNMPPKSKH